MVIAGREITEKQIEDRIAYLQTRAMVADQHCDAKSRDRFLAELDWLACELKAAKEAA